MNNRISSILLDELPPTTASGRGGDSLYSGLDSFGLSFLYDYSSQRLKQEKDMSAILNDYKILITPSFLMQPSFIFSSCSLYKTEFLLNFMEIQLKRSIGEDFHGQFCKVTFVLNFVNETAVGNLDGTGLSV